MEEIIEILMKRDENTRAEAKERIKEVLQLMDECNYDPDECDNILMEMLGLEPDYLFYLL